MRSKQEHNYHDAGFGSPLGNWLLQLFNCFTRSVMLRPYICLKMILEISSWWVEMSKFFWHSQTSVCCLLATIKGRSGFFRHISWTLLWLLVSSNEPDLGPLLTWGSVNLYFLLPCEYRAHQMYPLVLCNVLCSDSGTWKCLTWSPSIS